MNTTKPLLAFKYKRPSKRETDLIEFVVKNCWGGHYILGENGQVVAYVLPGPLPSHFPIFQIIQDAVDMEAT